MPGIIFNTPEILLNFLMTSGFDIHVIHECSYYQDITGRKYMVCIDDILPDVKDNHIEFLMDRFDKEELYRSDDQSSFYMDDPKKMKNLIEKLVPSQKDTYRSYSNVMFYCYGKRIFNKLLDTLFKVSVKNIRAQKTTAPVMNGMQNSGSTDSFIYLVWVSDMKSFVPISKFCEDTNIKIFYPAISSNFGIWIEWGVRFDFSEAYFHRVLLTNENESLFIFKDGKRSTFKLGLTDFITLIKFMKLKYAYGSMTGMGRLEKFESSELEYKLSLKRDSFRSKASRELEYLKKQEKYIRERIEWIENIESIYENQNIYNVYFYPYSMDRKDPSFPSLFLKHLPLYRLRQFKLYFGNIGTLGKGVLMTDKKLIDHDKGIPHDIPTNLHPRDGMIFQSNPLWMTKANLRVFTPLGLDLFPYLEVDQNDKNSIVDAFIDTTIWEIQKKPDGTGIRILPDHLIQQQIKKIKQDPTQYLFFIFHPPGMFVHHSDNQQINGILIHEQEFSELNIKINNLGIHFSMNDEEKNINKKTVESTIVNSVSGSYDKAAKKLNDLLEKAFQEDRKRIKERIEKTEKFIKKKDQELDKLHNNLNESFNRIKTDEIIINDYKEFIKNLKKDYETIFKKAKQSAKNYMDEICTVMEERKEGIHHLINENNATEDKIKKDLYELKDHIIKTKTLANQLKNEWDSMEKNLQTLEHEWKKIEEDLKNNQWALSDIRKEMDIRWNLHESFKGLDNYLILFQNHIESAVINSAHLQFLNKSSIDNIDDMDKNITTWVDHSTKNIEEIQSIWEKQKSEKNLYPFDIKDIETNVNNFFTQIEKLLEDIHQYRKDHRYRLLQQNFIINYLNKLKEKMKQIIKNIR